MYVCVPSTVEVLIQKWKQPKIKGWSFPTNRHIRHRTFIFNFDQYFFPKRIFYTPFFVLFKRKDYFFPFTIRTCKRNFYRNFAWKIEIIYFKGRNSFLNFTSELWEGHWDLMRFDVESICSSWMHCLPISICVCFKTFIIHSSCFYEHPHDSIPTLADNDQ